MNIYVHARDQMLRKATVNLKKVLHDKALSVRRVQIAPNFHPGAKEAHCSQALIDSPIEGISVDSKIACHHFAIVQNKAAEYAKLRSRAISHNSSRARKIVVQ